MRRIVYNIEAFAYNNDFMVIEYVNIYKNNYSGIILVALSYILILPYLCHSYV